MITSPPLKFILFALVLSLTHAKSEQNKNSPYIGIYCGDDKCYDLLELTREASASDIKKAFRNLSSK
jgi:hypothetical protein